MEYISLNKSARRGVQLVPIGMPTVCLKNISTKHNKYVVNQKLEDVDDISFREHFGRIRVFFSQNKICPFLAFGGNVFQTNSWHTNGY
jgi:hypothetical protein